ncbi:flexible cuticle protein 12-like [Pieris rapae]|uniref:flexible cuticle protein 12-like n=1 Tax=Pieris rapae TaxID=64459 RepID=UPI000B92AE8F|nr:flexible cuticle protein 12-like [Pieris rapae]
MKSFIILSALAAVTLCAPVDPETDVELAQLIARRRLPALEHEEIHDEFGQYALRYVTAEGTVVSERGRLVPTADGKDYVLVIEGEVSFIGDDGQLYVTKFSAGIDGVKMEGAHLPKAPEPEPIA